MQPRKIVSKSIYIPHIKYNKIQIYEMFFAEKIPQIFGGFLI